MAAMPGRVSHIDGPVIAIDGLEEASIHDIVEVEGGGRALVTALWRDRVEAVALDRVSIGAAAQARGPLAVPAGKALLGRIIDPLGRPLDGGPAIGEQVHPVFFAPPNLPEIGSAKRLTTGLLVYDLQQVIQTGSSILATGRAHIARHVLRHQARAGRVAIYVRTTGGAHDLPMARALFETQDSRIAGAPRTLRPCIAIEPAADAPRAMGWLAPFSAMAVAAAFRERGQDVVVLLDDLEDWRSTMSEVPWQGHPLSQIGQLTTQCCTTAKGSVTLLAGVSPDFVNVRSAASMFDLRLDLDDAARGTPAWLISTRSAPGGRLRDPIRRPSSLSRARWPARKHETANGVLGCRHDRHSRVASSKSSRSEDDARKASGSEFHVRSGSLLIRKRSISDSPVSCAHE